MVEMIEWIKHQNMDILYLDLRGLSEEDVVEHFHFFKKMVLDEVQKGNVEVRYLANFMGGAALPAIVQAVQDAAKETKQYVKKGAIVVDTVSVAKRVLMQAYNAATGGNRAIFKDEAEAKEWLVAP
ncbi:MAG: hypothetical protein GY854_22630 [Deltaproteobacteria bacterium]|nr:hypothetical protein [Deltaproteobacteria bacterium]